MKNASSAMQAIMASGQFILYHLYDITLVTGQTYHFTDGEVPLEGVTTYLPGGLTAGPFNYQTGMIITRGTIHQKAGTESGSCKITFVPQADSPYSPVTIAGYDIRQAARYGFLDGAVIRISKMYLLPPAATGGQLLLTGGSMGYFEGDAQEMEVDDLFCEITVEDYLSLVGAQQMPRALQSVGCFHQVYDPGCGLLAASLTVSGAFATVGDEAHMTTNLTEADGWFNLGSITITSGAASGQIVNISSYLNAGGALALCNPLSVLPSPGDTFTCYPGCDRQQATCSAKFNNLAHFGGAPYTPVPETILDGTNGQNVKPQTPGATAGQLVGSQASGKSTYGSYAT